MRDDVLVFNNNNDDDDDGHLCRPCLCTLFPVVLNPDNSFEILIDQTVVNSGNLLNDMTPAVNPPAEIEDPDDHKPDDWDERPKIPDPDAVKPDDWCVLVPVFIRYMI